MKLKIAQAGEPVLRGPARPLSAEEIGSERIRELIDLMLETLRDAPGVGLAAPQIGEPLQLAIVEDRAEYQSSLTEAELNERGRRPVPFHVLINPKIELLSPPEVSFYEGCLSVSGFVALVPRAHRVRVNALNELGNPIEIVAEGWYARILQHEIDHLQGTLYIDRMWSRSFCSIDQYTRHWKTKLTSDARKEFRPAAAANGLTTA
ncbi:peptide deformylase [Terriglobus roseus]|uniref:Peptide deformylase n=1 Tax=Terriglobus roseus TaxID=392734 RepID=A0A1G7HGS4_9BACT|nr:peptide deformylase [Terriglobus roseus]SDE99526.1 peptide deformylase [Terriglobus roseus]